MNEPKKTRFFGNGSKVFHPATQQKRHDGSKWILRDANGSDIHQNGDIKAGCNIFALQCTCQLQ